MWDHESAATAHVLEIGARFRCLMEERIARLETDAANDEAMIDRLENENHIRRQMHLVAVQRQDALRMRRFLDRSGTRGTPPIIAR